MRTNHLILAGAVFLTACATPGDKPQSARIIEPTEASRAALQQSVEHALGAEITLDDNALTESSTLVLERSARRNQARLQGRERDDPERFFLLRYQGDCLLEYERTGQRYRLPDTRCEPE